MEVGLAAAIASALLYGAPVALQARASRRIARGSLWRQVLTGARDPLMLTVVGCYLLGAVGHYVAILLLPLYLAQAAVALSLVFTALASWWLLGERPSRSQWWGLAAMVAGLGLLVAASGEVGRTDLPTSTTWVLLAAAAAVLVLGLGVRQWLHRRAVGWALGLLSGLAYGAVPLGVRAIGVAHLDTHTMLTGVATALLGSLGFALYSMALAAAPVNTSTAPLVLAQTVLPALVGIWWLGDGVRAGWQGELVLGLVVSLGGAIALSLAEALPDDESAPEMVAS